ncbi:MAG: hypothetical protein AB7F86_12810 [Bdellovibrionales bacterium]
MGEKKGKALAMELIDDLLNDKTEGIEDVPIEAEKEIPVEEDHTERLSESKIGPAMVKTQASSQQTQQSASKPSDRVKASVGRFGALRTTAAPSSTEAALAQSESLRIAQGRILELEQEIERLRLQNEELGAAGETLRLRTDELLALNNRRETDYQNALARFDHEKAILSASKEALQRDVENLRRKNEELELRISSNVQKIRVRERELENRLELMKMESAALIRSKDEMILELKRHIDQLNMELGNYRTKNQELNRQTNDRQEMLRRTVKALRLALSMLEGEEDGTRQQQRKGK